MKISRLIAASLLAASTAAFAADCEPPKYIFYFIGDGMGPGAVMGTDTYLRLAEGRTGQLLWETFPAATICSTFSASSPVTDSAAAGTALATGRKTLNNMLGMTPDSVPARNIAEDFKALGYGIGLVTNVAADDATPGAFYAHVPSRDMAYDIDCQAAESDVDFLAGSRIRGNVRNRQYTGIYEKFAENGWDVVKGVKNYNSKSPKVLLLNDADTLSNNAGYAIDFPKEWNLLRDYTDAAITHMTTHSPEKFFLMIEGGNIDWAGHDNDAATIVTEVLDFEETMRLAYDFYLSHPDETLIVVTADHETGGMTVGQKSVGYNCYPKRLDNQKISKAKFLREIVERENPVTPEEMKQILSDKLGFFTTLKLSRRQQKRLDDAFESTFVKRDDEKTDALYNAFPAFVEEVYAIMSEISGYGFTTPKHSGNPVGVYAIGCGSENFTRSMDNTDIPTLLRKIAGAN